MVLNDENLAQAKGCLQKKKKNTKNPGFLKPILWGLLLCDFFFSLLLSNHFNKIGIRKGKGKLYNANWPLGARTD